MREIFQFVENKGKLFVRTTEILNKIVYKNLKRLNILDMAKFLIFFQENFEKFARNH